MQSVILEKVLDNISCPCTKRCGTVRKRLDPKSNRSAQRTRQQDAIFGANLADNLNGARQSNSDNVLICEELDYKNIVFKCPACGTRITVTIGEQYVRDNY